jgi:hypothetical protein
MEDSRGLSSTFSWLDSVVTSLQVYLRYLSQEMEQLQKINGTVLHQARYRTKDDEEAEALTAKASSTIGFFIPPSGLF